MGSTVVGGVAPELAVRLHALVYHLDAQGRLSLQSRLDLNLQYQARNYAALSESVV